jgi:hypothetical protein
MSEHGGRPPFPQCFVAFAASSGDEPIKLTVPNPEPSGMSLRDWFAGNALAAVMPLMKKRGVEGIDEITVSRHVYLIADAMIAERTCRR